MMTDTEKKLAIALVGCTFLPGSPPKRFACQMADHAKSSEPKPLTEKQAAWLRTLVRQYRRQLPSEIVLLAQ